MHYVILRDDDTNALTPVECLDRLYRPFLDRKLPVNLAVIPNVRTDIRYGDGILEGFLTFRNGSDDRFAAFSENPELVRYLRQHPEFHIVQHGCRHEFVRSACEFELRHAAEVARRIEEGTDLLVRAGFPKPETFVAPYDRFTRTSLAEVARRFRVISTGWFEWGRLPVRWWPDYARAKSRRQPHWRVNGTVLLSHPGCLLSYHRKYDTILPEIRRTVRSRKLTILVTHWWEFFREQRPDEALIDVLHATAEYLASDPEVSVISFREVAGNPDRYL